MSQIKPRPDRLAKPVRRSMPESRCRRIVAARDEGRCQRCGVLGPVSMHHRLNRSQRGQWSPENIVTLCGSGTTGCHGWVTENPRVAATGGWTVLRDLHGPDPDPAGIEVESFWGTVLYLHDGQRIEVA